MITGYYSGMQLFKVQDSTWRGKGWVTLGSGFNYAQFDNFFLDTPSSQL